MSLVNGGDLQYDENQYQIILQFMKVQAACQLPKLVNEESVDVAATSDSTSFFGSLWDTVTGGDKVGGSDNSPSTSSTGENQETEDRRGIYLYGSVGIGLVCEYLFSA